MRGVHASAYLTLRDSGRRLTAPIASFLDAGCGFGGSCLPKDVSALVAHGRGLDVDMRLLDAVLRVNRDRPERVVDGLKRHFPSLRGRRVTVLGLAFKPDTDDVRESPAFPIIRRLREEGAAVSAYDPVANEPARRVLGDDGIRFCEGLEPALRGAEAVLIVTRWGEFAAVPELLRDADPAPLVFDGRRMLDKNAVRRYDGIGL
jgi:UDPglucose 6-dehydrogenase/GDP-mannose 6-dehydrogenase